MNSVFLTPRAMVPIRKFFGKLKRKYWSHRFRHMNNEEIFTEIYRRRLWGRHSNYKFDSGTGSHDADLIDKYVQSVIEFIGPKIQQMSAIDVGCGDFEVGKNIYFYFKEYLAVDVNSQLIKYNATEYKNPNLNFEVLDATNQLIPEFDVVFIRQVLQHLSNKSIQDLIINLPKDFHYLIVTEHLPNKDFYPNLDIETGFQTRLIKNSGVILHEPPFMFKNLDFKKICEVPVTDGLITTFIYINNTF